MQKHRHKQVTLKLHTNVDRFNLLKLHVTFPLLNHSPKDLSNEERNVSHINELRFRFLSFILM